MRRNVVNLLGAERRGGLLHLHVELDQHRLHRSHDERQRHEQQGDDDTGACVGQLESDRALGAVESQQHESGDDRRQGERQVDERVDDALARKSSRTSTQAISVPITALSRRRAAR